MNTTRIEAILIFIGGLIIFTMGLASQEIISFESRFYLFALEMWRHGVSWFPMTYDKPYADYPATSTWLIYLFATLFGGLNKFSAVFPSALASAITLTLTYLIGALHSRYWGVCAALFLLFTVTFVVEARTISLDQFITAITASCFYLVYSAKLLEKPKRAAWVFFFFVLGFAFRGPLGLVIPTGVVCMFYLLEKDIKSFFRVGLIAALLLAVCTGLLLALAYHAGGEKFVYAVLDMEILGRIQERQTPPIYFYFIESLGAYAVTFPLAILVLLGVAKERNSEEVKLIKKCCGWVLVILIGLSIPADKKVRYILPIAPALALICGYLFIVAREQRYLAIVHRFFLGFCALFPLLCLAAVFWFHYRYPQLEFYFRPIIMALIAMEFAILFSRRHELHVFLFAVMSFIMMLTLVIEPINLSLNRTQSFVRDIENVRHQMQAQLIFYRLGKDGLAIKYLVNMEQEGVPIFVSQPEELLRLKSPAVIIATEENYRQIPNTSFHLLKIGSLGHEPAVAFSKTVSPQAGGF